MSSVTEVEPIDFAHLAQYTGGDAQLDAEVLRMFAEQCAQAVVQLQALCDAPVSRSWREIAHTLKGAAAGVGAFGVAEWAGRAESIDPVVARDNAADCLSQLRGRCTVAKAFIDAYLKR